MTRPLPRWQGPLPRIGLAERRHREGGKRARRLADLSIAHSIASAFITVASMPIESPGAFDTFVGALKTAEEIPAPDNDRDLTPGPPRLSGQRAMRATVLALRPNGVRPHQRLSRKLHDDAAEQGAFRVVMGARRTESETTDAQLKGKKSGP